MTTDTERLKAIDELGVLENSLADVEECFKRREALRKRVRAWPAEDKASPASTVCYSSKKYVLALGPCENQRKIRSLAAVFKAVGKSRFVAACGLTLKALEELVGEANAPDYVVEERTGSRTITVAKAA